MKVDTYEKNRDLIIDTPAGNGKAAAATLSKCKQELCELEHRLALKQLDAAHRQVRWKVFNMHRAWEHLHGIPLKDLSGVARVAALGMVLNREADDKQRLSGTEHQGDHGECLLCTRPCKLYPYGRHMSGACELHADIDTWWHFRLEASIQGALLHCVTLPQPHPRTLPA